MRLRDKECVLCGKTNGLAAHHWIHSRAQGNKHRWNIKNGITLCFTCHIYKVHHYASADVIGQLNEVAFERGIISKEELDNIANDHSLLKAGITEMEATRDYLTDYLEQLKEQR